MRYAKLALNVHHNTSLRALKVRGAFKGPSGYDHHVREFVRELHAQGVAIELVDIPDWSSVELPAHLRDPWFDSLDKPTDARTVLHFCLPRQFTSSTNYSPMKLCPGSTPRGRTTSACPLAKAGTRRWWRPRHPDSSSSHLTTAPIAPTSIPRSPPLSRVGRCRPISVQTIPTLQRCLSTATGGSRTKWRLSLASNALSPERIVLTPCSVTGCLPSLTGQGQPAG